MPHLKSFSVFHLSFTSHLRNSLPLYLTNTLRTFAVSLIGLFIPIYIYQISDEFFVLSGNTVLNGIYYILLFYFIRSLFTLAAMPKIVDLIFGTIKFNGSIILGNILLALALYFLIIADQYNFAVFLAPIFLAVSTTLYWIPFHTYFVRNMKNVSGHFGKQTGIRLFLASIATAAGPALGGIVVKYYGFDFLFWIGIFMLLFSGLPILFGLPEHNHGKHSVIHIFKKYWKNPLQKNNTIAQMANGIDGEVCGMFGPLLLFLVSPDIIDVGYITSISVSLAAVFTLVVGKIIDEHGPVRVQRIGLFFNSLFYLPRIVFSQVWFLYSIDVLDKLNSSFSSVPFLASTYENTRNDDSESEYMIYREFIIHIGICFAVVVVALIILLTGYWRFVFLMLAMVSPFSYLVSVKNKS